MIFSAPASPSGLRVNCTAAASARNSRWRDTARLMRSASTMPMSPVMNSRNPSSIKAGGAPPPCRRASVPRRAMDSRIEPLSKCMPASLTSMMPNRSPIRRILMSVSPFSRWLNSCAMTPCNCSRLSSSIAPRVTPMAASRGENPTANALMPASSSRNTGGAGTPEAMAISSTTFSSRRSRKSSLLGMMRRPPRDSATPGPPPARSIADL